MVDDRSDWIGVDIQDRLRGMIWGQFVGDAAALGSHWIYNITEMEAAWPGGVNGFEEPRPGHYHEGKRSGDQTHYGDAALLLLTSVAEQGRMDVVDFGERFFERMHPDRYEGYIDHATRGTFENRLDFEGASPREEFDFQQGADDDQLATISSLAPVVAAHLSVADGELRRIVERVTRVRQNSDRTVAYVWAHARILCHLLHGRDIHSALHRAVEDVRTDVAFGREIGRKIDSAMALMATSVVEATDRLGQSCPLISSFPSAVHSLIKTTGEFASTIIAVLRAGGDNAGRAAIAGSWLGAHRGVASIPSEWRDRLTHRNEIDAAVESIVASIEAID